MTKNGFPFEPIRTRHKVQWLTDAELDNLQAATLDVLENIGVKFPSQKALSVFEEHGAAVDRETQIVKLPADLVMQAMSSVPRYFKVGGRKPEYNFPLQEGYTYFCTDGCGHDVVDLQTGKIRPSTKADVGMTARVADYLKSMAFYWPMVSAQDYGTLSPLHELDAIWNNSLKHIQSETLMGAELAKYAIEMGEVVAGSKKALRENPVFSVLICTISPLVQDKEGIEGAMLLAEAGIPVVFLAMPSMGSTAPGSIAGAYVVADAEIISATVLLQLIAPGAPVSHSVMQAWVDPRTGGYVPYPVDARARYAPVNIAHHWNMSSFGGAFGTESHNPGTWQAAADVALDPLLISLAGVEWVTGIGLNRSFTLLHPEAIIYDDELYHRARFALADTEVSPETIALDVIAKVGPGGHFLSQRHTSKHMREIWAPGLGHDLGPDGKYRPIDEVARERLAWILENHHPEPLDENKQKELTRILAAAEKELGKE
jgi:trimethylamine--corrinoid protein Co-methyltransferase